ncbi:HutD family protein [Pseudomonas sp. DTU_2021_1001937_2_SI_NGA_ILE_001]|uniref:HutD/Ves family protein n=1 Tax=Pseudomonas sp. DTU_2021_1001937_2_SI_NGA_ILE_001 TaxID=3077589 RepID=UPI0028FC0D4D|nr:HutD family protein [Pseudomonas sp. DTU_2021_1001937_2_SI_NGA_ILE_001]WNW12962.1 HutD family protein [Pseudomonas sp. DTU_2021_1001937_2_SI_NGA_ILE_001]
MKRTTLLRAADYPSTPWKNGGGTSHEITRDAGQALDDFGWRLSMVDVEKGGAFSAFTGYQRIITVLQGAGMALEIDGQPSRALPVSDPMAFSGDSEVICHLSDGPVRDFNLIYDAQCYDARLQWLDVRQPQRVFSSASTLLVFSVAQQMAVSIDEGLWEILGHYDCLRTDNPGGLLEIELQAPSASRCCLIELSARGEP